MRTSTIEAINRWLHFFPDSHHPNDEERFYDMIIEAYQNDDLDDLLDMDLEQYLRNKRPNMPDDRIRIFINKWTVNVSLCVGLIQRLFQRHILQK